MADTQDVLTIHKNSHDALFGLAPSGTKRAFSDKAGAGLEPPRTGYRQSSVQHQVVHSRRLMQDESFHYSFSSVWTTGTPTLLPSMARDCGCAAHPGSLWLPNQVLDHGADAGQGI